MKEGRKMNKTEIQVGEYCRVDGSIAKLLSVNEYENSVTFDSPVNIPLKGVSKTITIYDMLRYTTNHSHNIIDLIEVDDIVDITILGEDTEFGATDPIGAIWHIKDESMLHNIKQGCKLGTFELESILTHEEFNDNKYQANEEEEKEYE